LPTRKELMLWIKLEDILFAKASETIDTYKKTVASTYFDEPTEDTTEEQ